MTEAAQNDVLILPDDSRHVLAAGSMGDIQVTVLNRTNQPDTARTLRVTCYVFGQKIVFDVLCGVKRRIAAKCDDVIREEFNKKPREIGQF